MRPLSDVPGCQRDDRGQITVLLIGFAMVLLLAVVVVVDASAAFISRQGLDTLADGAALSGADQGATGREVYAEGVPQRDLELSAGRAKEGAVVYLRRVGAYDRYPGLQVRVRVDGTKVDVRLEARVEVPLTMPGVTTRPLVGATGSAIVSPDD